MQSLSKFNKGIKYLLCAIGPFNKYAVVCINGSARPHFRPHFFRFFNIVAFLLKLSIRKFLTPFILLIHSFYTNNINFLNTPARKSDLSLPLIHTTLTYHNKLSHKNNHNNHYLCYLLISF